MKTCIKCQIDKPQEEFPQPCPSKASRGNCCRECLRSAYKDYYKRNRDKVVAKVKIRNKSSRDKRKQEFDELRASIGCSKCNETHPATLDFHHIDPSTKIGLVSYMFNNLVPMHKVRKEIAKCIVLCSNCHRKLHWDQRN